MMGAFPAAMNRLILPARFGVLGAMLLGLMGGIAGLIIGLLVHPPTAWFAIFELGVPAAFVGGTLGVLTGLVIAIARRLKRKYGVGTRPV